MKLPEEKIIKVEYTYENGDKYFLDLENTSNYLENIKALSTMASRGYNFKPVEWNKSTVISKEDFVNYINLIQFLHKKESKLNKKFGVDISAFSKKYHVIIELLKMNLFTKSKLDLINWWLYERQLFVNAKPLRLYDENGNELDVDTPEKFYDILFNPSKKTRKSLSFVMSLTKKFKIVLEILKIVK